jgi:hypothetical protein
MQGFSESIAARLTLAMLISAANLGATSAHH